MQDYKDILNDVVDFLFGIPVECAGLVGRRRYSHNEITLPGQRHERNLYSVNITTTLIMAFNTRKGRQERTTKKVCLC